MTDVVESRWRRFWNRGGWWRALLLAAVYYGIYQLISFPSDAVFRGVWGEEGGALFVLLKTGMPILLAAIVLVAFGFSIGWIRELFGPQPIRGSWWMWIAVVVVLGWNILRFLSLDVESAGVPLIASWMLTGLFIGFAEELLTRGFAVTLLRKGGYREFAVALLSATIFAALHIGNAFVNQDLVTTVIQVSYTFCFGICMYLALRVTGTIIAPILLHASTDPSIFLLTAHPSDGPLTSFANLGNFGVMLVGIVLLLFVRGRVTDKDAAPALGAASLR